MLQSMLTFQDFHQYLENFLFCNISIPRPWASSAWRYLCCWKGRISKLDNFLLWSNNIKCKCNFFTYSAYFKHEAGGNVTKYWQDGDLKWVSRRHCILYCICLFMYLNMYVFVYLRARCHRGRSTCPHCHFLANWCLCYRSSLSSHRYHHRHHHHHHCHPYYHHHSQHRYQHQEDIRMTGLYSATVW